MANCQLLTRFMVIDGMLVTPMLYVMYRLIGDR